MNDEILIWKKFVPLQLTALKVWLKSSLRKYYKEFPRLDSFTALLSLSTRVLSRMILFINKVLKFIFLLWMDE